MKWEATKCQDSSNAWKAETSDRRSWGQVFHVRFHGSNAEQLAREYAVWRTDLKPDEPVKTPKVESLVVPKFKPGDICMSKIGLPGIITHHLISLDTVGSKVVKYKGYYLTAERFGQAWSYEYPELLFSLGDCYYNG